MNEVSALIDLLREAEKLLSLEGNQQGADWAADICDSLSLGDPKAIEELKNNIGGMGGFWEFSNSKKFQQLIERIGGELDEIAL